MFLLHCKANGPIVFRGAIIGGNFECSGSLFKSVTCEAASCTSDLTGLIRGGRAIDCQGAKIGGSIYFRPDDNVHFRANGEVCFIDADIAGSFECHGAAITNEAGSALSCSRMKVTGTVFLHEGFAARGSVKFRGATIGGDLECGGGTFLCPNEFYNTPGRVAIDCHGVKIGGGIFFRRCFKAEGEVVFVDAEVSGSFECHGALIDNPGGHALKCSRMRVGGSVFLINGFKAHGGVGFRRADIGGNFEASFCTFSPPLTAPLALTCEGAHITGSVQLGGTATDARIGATAATAHELTCKDKIVRSFTATGCVDFFGAHIEGDFNCESAVLINSALHAPGPSGEPQCDDALRLHSVVISGALLLGSELALPIIWGSLDLRDAKATVFGDAGEPSWPPKEVSEASVPSGCETAEHVTAASAGRDNSRRLQCHIYLDGFVYDRIASTTPINAAIRNQWLRRQPDYRPQPFEQLTKVLRAMGHEDESRQIAMFKQQQLQPLRVRGAALWGRPFVGVIGVLWKLFAGYGYRPHRLLLTLIVLWLSSAAIYQMAADHGAIVPNDPQVWNSDLRATCEPNWTTCDKVKDILAFNALAFSADVLLPVIDLRQRSVWIPKDGWIRMVTWAENILGSLGVLLLGAILGGLVKRD